MSPDAFDVWIQRGGSASLRERKNGLLPISDLIIARQLEQEQLLAFALFIKNAIFTYFDSSSRDLLVETVRLCAEKQGEKSLLFLSKAIQGVTGKLCSAIITPNLGKSCAFAFRISLVILHECPDNSEAFEPLYKCCCQLLSAVCKAGKERYCSVAFRSFSTYLDNTGVEKFVDKLEKLSGVLSPEEKMICWSFIYRYLDSKQEKQLTERYKVKTIELVVALLGTKTGVDKFVSSNWHFALKCYTKEDLEKGIMPVLQKQMLRSPEVIIATLSDLMNAFSIDLSDNSDKLAKMCCPSIISQDESIQKSGRLSLEALTKKCSTLKACQEIIKYLSAVLGGSEGKLSNVNQKLSLLCSVKSAQLLVPRNHVNHLVPLVISGMAPLLKSEVSEQVIMEMLDALALWCSAVDSVPKELITTIEVGLGLKTTNMAIQVAYFNCYLSTLNKSMAVDKPSFFPCLEEAARISLNKNAVAANYPLYLVAGCVLFKLALRLRKSDEDLNKLLSQMIQSGENLPFLNDRFLTTSTNEYNLILLELIEMLTINNSVGESVSFNSVTTAILRNLVNPDKKVRQEATLVVRRICTSANFKGLEFALHLLKNIGIVSSEAHASHGVLAVCCNDGFSEQQALTIAEEGLTAAHSMTRPVWSKVLEFLRIPLEKINSKKLLENLLSNERLDDCTLKCISSLAGYFPEVVYPQVSVYVDINLKDPSIGRTTEYEVQVFNSPQGEVYDKTVIGQARQSPEKNMKRESKAYSYEDQMFEIELKKLSNQKRGVQFTPKEKELLAIQLERENAIRDKLRVLSLKVENSKSLILALVKGCDLPKEMLFANISPYMDMIVGHIMNLICTYFAADTMSNLYYQLVEVCAPQKYLGLSVFYATLRVKENCKAFVDEEWTKEGLVSALRRTVKEVHAYIVGVRDESEYSELMATELAERRHKLTTMFFNLMFPLLATVMNRSFDRETNTKCMQLLEAYYVPDFDEDDESYELCNPAHMCSSDVTYTLLMLGQNMALRHQVETSLIGVCRSLSVFPASMAVVNGILELLYCPNEFVRLMCFKALKELTANHKPSDVAEVTKSTWMFKCDPNENVKEAAEDLWQSLELQPSPGLFDVLADGAVKPQAHARTAAAQGMYALSCVFPVQIPNVIRSLKEKYVVLIMNSEPARDNFGRIIDINFVDTWFSRWGVAHAIRIMAPNISDQSVVIEVFRFFIPTGLSDPNSSVNSEMVEAGLAIVDANGKESVTPLLKLIDEYLKDAEQTDTADKVRQNVVILMGALARHLDRTDNRVKPIVRRLLELLSVPSQTVQEAVSSCLPPLAPAIKGEAQGIINNLMSVLLNSENYGERKGAAYGLAGLVKGLGILSLKQMNIMSTLTEAIQDKKNVRKKEGALFAFEILCNVLGKLFEPYIVHILGHLLTCFGDPNQYVREATECTAKAIMRHLTGHGVKLTLPTLLAALEDDSWRTKCGAVELLGSMAYCAPKQLSTCLPTVVPKLIQVLSDSHVKVQQAGAQALKQVGLVIRNPEIQEIVDVLLGALQDPGNKTSSCLSTLLETRFVHFIDAPSLALIMPVVQRAFQDRSTETRKMAAQIIGNMYSLTDQKDLMPYLPSILPGLKTCLLDPVPEVRTVSARALGTIIKGTGEQCFDNLVPWLMETLTSEASPVDRSGAAQGLSEVIGGMGVQKLQALMPELIQSASREDIEPHFRDGYLMMFIYLPLVFQKEFTPYIEQIIRPILTGLADETEFVRDTALLAGQRMVSMYAETAIQLLLPELEKGLFHDNWRIRYSSVQLIGDLLYKISGVSGKMTTETADEDDNFGTEHSHSAIADALGGDRRNKLFSGLYMGRLDTSLMVRQSSVHVWKVVVSNTPRTLREILPTMFSILLKFLASNSHDKQQIAAKTLGDLVKKLGERVLPEIIPILERQLNSTDAVERQGVCIGLSEIVACTSRAMVLHFLDSLVPTVRKALCDPLKEVRCAAARTFDSLHTSVGPRALEEIITPLFNNIESDDRELAEQTLDGLRQVMMLRSKYVLPHLVPQLTKPPVNTKALSYICSVAQGDALLNHFPRILDALLETFSKSLDTPMEVEQLSYCRSVVLAAQDPDCVQVIVDTLLNKSKTNDPTMKRACVAILCTFCTNTKSSLEEHLIFLIRDLVKLFLESQTHILALSAEALLAVIKQIEPARQKDFVIEIRGAIRSAATSLSKGELLPGLCQEKGTEPVIMIYKEALLSGTPELKESAAIGLGEMIRLTDAASLKPKAVSNFTGPLIRILGDRYAFTVKTAVLSTLTLLLKKVESQLKPFLPQLHSTFQKALADQHRNVRLHAAVALGYLTRIHPKAQLVLQELHNSAKTVDDPTVRETTLFGIRCVLKNVKNEASVPDAQRRSLVQTMTQYGTSTEDSCRKQAASCLGSLCRVLPSEELATISSQYMFDSSNQEWTNTHFRVVSIQVALKEAAPALVPNHLKEMEVTLSQTITSDKMPIIEASCRAVGYMIIHCARTNNKMPANLLTSLAKSLNHPSNEIKQLVGQVIQCVAHEVDLPVSMAKPLIPMLVNGTKEKNTVVRANSEFALITLLKIINEERSDTFIKMEAALDVGARESLQDAYQKTLLRTALKSNIPYEDMDDTMLM